MQPTDSTSKKLKLFQLRPEEKKVSVHRAKFTVFEFKCSCCEETIFSSYHVYSNPMLNLSLHGSRLTLNGTDIRLRPTQAFILAILAETYPKPILIDDIKLAIDSVGVMSRWKHKELPLSSNVLTVHISKLREKLKPLGLNIVQPQYTYYQLELTNERATP